MRKRRPKTERQKAIAVNDKLFREIIRKRDNFTCQKSHRNNVPIDVAHFYRRNILRTRWDFDNACCLQKGLHRFWAHSHYEEFRDFWIGRIGQKRFNKLKLKANYVAPVKTFDIYCVRELLKKRLKTLRKGEGG